MSRLAAIFWGILIVVLSITIATGILAFGSRVESNSQAIERRDELSALRTQIVQDALRQECESMNEKFSRFIPLEKQSKAQILTLAYYKEHPDEARKAIASIDRTIAILQPNDCSMIKIKVPNQ